MLNQVRSQRIDDVLICFDIILLSHTSIPRFFHSPSIQNTGVAMLISLIVIAWWQIDELHVTLLPGWGCIKWQPQSKVKPKCLLPNKKMLSKGCDTQGRIWQSLHAQGWCCCRPDCTLQPARWNPPVCNLDRTCSSILGFGTKTTFQQPTHNRYLVKKKKKKQK